MVSTYIQSRNGHYHFRFRTPVDLQGIISQREITKSLKTSSLKTAKVSALPYVIIVKQTVTLLRGRYITAEQAQEKLYTFLKWKPTVQTQSVSDGVKETSSPSSDVHLLSEIIKQYISDRQSEWTPKTSKDISSVFNLIIGLIGDIPIESITRAKAREFKNQLLKLPPNVSKLYPKHSPLEVLKMIDSGKITVKATLSIKSVNKHISRLSWLMTYCIREGYRPDNPASGMNIKQHKRQDEERKAYDKEDIQRIIKNLPPKEDKPERYWVPLICMYSGMRIDEACQLYKADIVKHQDILCFDVNDSKDKKLKNLASRRVIPIHPKLIELGLLEHVDKCHDDGRLWKNLKKGKYAGYSNALGKWFQKFNRRFVTKDSMKTFHSLRHSFADTLKRLLVEKSVVSELLGHADDSMTFGRYGKRYEAKVLLSAISLIEYLCSSEN